MLDFLKRLSRKPADPRSASAPSPAPPPGGRPASGGEAAAAPASETIATPGEVLNLTDRSEPTDRPRFRPDTLLRMTIAGPAAPPPPRPLWPGTDPWAGEVTRRWHAGLDLAPRDVACTFATDVVVAGDGEIWLGGALVTAPEIMPDYVRNQLERDGEGRPVPLDRRSLPTRTVAAPCVVLLGHGVQVYGHFLIELLFRLLVVRRAWGHEPNPPRVLLDRRAPNWLLKILNVNFGVVATAIEWFDPDRERVLLRQAVLPGLVRRGDGFHPVANPMIDGLLDGLAVPASPYGRRVFVTRRTFRNAHSFQRVCLNEPALIAQAASRHGFAPVAVEYLSWPEQIAVFRDAEVVLGQWGSALHNALFSPAGTRVAALGVLNLVQSQIGALRGHDNAFLEEGVTPTGDFRVDEAAFAAFLDELLADPPA